MLQTVQKLAIADHEARKTALLELLNEIGVIYEIQHSDIEGILVENIIVKYGSAQKRIVIGAHYDNVDGSTGANDNASGVSILLELIRHFQVEPPMASLDIVFFDYEEFHMLGSWLYVNTFLEDISAMINLDVCGVGDTVLIAPQNNLIEGILADAVQKVDRETAPFLILEQLPEGDELLFAYRDIPNISVCIVEEQDVQLMSVLFSDQNETVHENSLAIMETMHNGSRDTVEVVTQEALEKVFKFVYELIMHMQ